MDQTNSILGIGLSGLVGSRIQELLSGYNFQDVSLSTGVDITRQEGVSDIVEKSEAKVVVHLAAKADVDGCEEDKALGENGDAWKINVQGAQNVINACLKCNKKLIYISTDFVFDGVKEFYSEEDNPNPVNWYGETKYQAEKLVKKSGLDYLVVRIAYPYRKTFELKKDFVRAIKDRLEQKLPVTGITDHIMTPTFIDDIAFALDALIRKNASGIYHVTGSSYITPYDAAVDIAGKFGLDQSLISKTTREEYFAGKATRPFKLALKNDKIKALGVLMKTFAEGLKLL